MSIFDDLVKVGSGYAFSSRNMFLLTLFRGTGEVFSTTNRDTKEKVMR